MVSIIKVTSVQDTSGNNETTTANIKKAYDGSSKAYIKMATDGSGTPAILSSLNVSSTTDSGTGWFFWDFTSNMSDGDYSVSYGLHNASTSSPVATFVTNTSSQVNAGLRYATSNSNSDWDDWSCQVHGDLA